MKKIKLALLISMLFFGISSTYAQTPSFIVDWNPCELQVSGSNYYVTYSLFNTSTGTLEVPETEYPIGIPCTYDFYSITIDNFNCSQNDAKPYYYLLVKVVLKDQWDNPYCAGQGRSSLLKCSDLYDDATTIPINMVGL